MSSKKVCILTSVHPVFDTRIFHKEAKTLAKAGYDVTLIAQHSSDEILNGVKIVALPRPKNRFFRIFGTTWKLFKSALEQGADIYHFHDPELIPAGLLLKALGKEVIYDVHEDFPRQILSKYWLPKWVRHPLSKLAEAVERGAVGAFDLIVVATPVIAERFSPEKTVVVQNFPILGELIRKDPSPYVGRPFLIVYVGGITAIRGIKEMVAAIHLLSETLSVRLALAGRFSPPDLEDEMSRVTGWDRVDFLGYKDRGEVAELFSKARVGLVLFHPLPNHVAAQPTKLFEYMAAGLPVVASDFPLWRKIVKDANCGLLVDPLDPKAISKAIKWLLEHPREAEKMGENGRKAVLEKYNWDVESKKLLYAYKRLEV